MTNASTSSTPRIQIVGGGKMGQALALGMVTARWAPAPEVAVVEVSAEQRAVLTAAQTGLAVVEEPMAGLDTILAVKPHLTVGVAASLDRPTRVLSVAAGITTSALEAVLPTGTPVIRVMPNTPALLNAGAAAAAPGSAATADDLDWATELLRSVGTVVTVSESQLDAVTGLSGSGPAYLFLVAEALTDAGVNVGLPRDVAATLAHQTILGAGRMLVETNQSAAELRAAVTTPSGTTAAGLRVLEQHGVRAALIDAVTAAAERSRQLGAE